MAIQSETLTSIYVFLGDFLAFLKSHRFLDSYILVHPDVNDAVLAQRDEEFVEKLLNYLEQLQGLLGTCSREKHYGQLDATEPYSCFDEREKACKLPRHSSDAANTAEDDNPGVEWQDNAAGFEVTPRAESFDALFEITPKADSLEPQADCHNSEKSSTEEESGDETAQDQVAVDQEESTNCSGEVAKDNSVQNKKAEVQQSFPLGLTIPRGGPYICTACHKEFRDKATLSRHFRRHTGEKPFKCEHCRKCFSSKVNLSAHLLRSHNIGIEKALCCAVCGKLFSRKNSLEVHMSIHRDNKPFECHMCHRTFAQKISLNIHIASQHTGELNYSCEVCDKSFASASALNTHRLSHGAPRLQCDLCGQMFRRPDVLKLHREVRHGLPFPRTRRCPTCDEAFRTASQLAAHMRTHGVNSQPKKLHGKAQRTRVKASFLCSTCGKKCCRLKDHERRHHGDGQAPAPVPGFACTYCPKTFVHKAKLQMHIVSHLEEPRYSCELCGTRFQRKDTLDRHVARHADPQPFACDRCRRRYSSRSSLRAHVEARHTERPEASRFSCGTCGKVYLQKSSFIEHTKTHTGEFRYQCETCEKRFVKRSHYESHVRVHSSERPYRCDTCERSYKEQKHLREHVRRVHPQVLSLEALVASLGDEEVATVDGGVDPAASGVGVTLVAGHAEVAAVLTPFVITDLPG
ncbi:zinc finger protein 2 homolog [Schistocerca americana]|uniref:zinc finger protein 2 homolog n=1 Tax=Schistocerca americana TaxID=7009 RepID=UPI001F5033B1|nr:zinc finger protein 2 homolog [Schistocerca americana]